MTSKVAYQALNAVNKALKFFFDPQISKVPRDYEVLNPADDLKTMNGTR